MPIAIPENTRKSLDAVIDHTREAITDGVESILETTHNVLLAGLGGLDFTAELPRRLIERGQASENQTIAKVRDVVERLPRELDVHLRKPEAPSLDEMRRKAEDSVADVRKAATEAVDDLKKTAEDAVHSVEEGLESAREETQKGVKKALHALPDLAPVTRKSLGVLIERVDGLAERVDALKTERASKAAPRKTKRAPAKTAAKSGAAKSPAAKTTAAKKTKAAAPTAQAEPVSEEPSDN